MNSTVMDPMMALASAESTVKIEIPLVPYTYFDNAKAQIFQIAIDLKEYVPLNEYFRDKYFELK